MEHLIHREKSDTVKLFVNTFRGIYEK